MAFEPGYSVDEAQLLMTLAASAYVDEKPLPFETVPNQSARMRRDIDASLSQSAYAGWQVVWGPGLTPDRANMMYIAGNTATIQYAVAVRGTDWSFVLDWLEDFGSLLPLVELPFLVPPGGNGIMIAAGTSLGLTALLQMHAVPADPTAATVSAETFLRALPADADVFVTGHSLGGCLASVVAPWVASLFGGSARVKAYTFAAPSAGNAAFASYYNTLFTDPTTGQSTAYRVYNSLDSVPNAWATLATIEAYYTPSPLCPEYIKDIVNVGIKGVGSAYVQVGEASAGSAVDLQGRLAPLPPWWGADPTGTVQFARQVAEQHATATYLSLLAATPVAGATVKLSAMGARIATAEPPDSGH